MDNPVFLGTRVDTSVETLPRAYQELESRIRSVVTKYQKGEVDEEDTLRHLAELKLADGRGNTWTVGASTGRWMYRSRESKRWLPGHPGIVS